MTHFMLTNILKVSNLSEVLNYWISLVKKKTYKKSEISQPTRFDTQLSFRVFVAANACILGAM